MKLPRPFRRLAFYVALAFAAPTLAPIACSKHSESATRYHCPMHPTYVSDHPGDCPICGMRLVPIEEKSASGQAGKSAAATPDVERSHEHEHPAQAASASGDVIWTCPMDPGDRVGSTGALPQVPHGARAQAEGDGRFQGRGEG
ncbi:MAG: heavy metal-binding domain-containing protein [Polyangiaceae bacterium]